MKSRLMFLGFAALAFSAFVGSGCEKQKANGLLGLFQNGQQAAPQGMFGLPVEQAPRDEASDGVPPVDWNQALQALHQPRHWADGPGEALVREGGQFDPGAQRAGTFYNEQSGVNGLYDPDGGSIISVRGVDGKTITWSN